MSRALSARALSARAVACRKALQGSKWIRPGLRHAIYLRDGYTCTYCGWRDDSQAGGTWLVNGRQIGLTLDHVIACELGGSNKPDNLVTSCLGCNSAKRRLTVRQWYVYLTTRRRIDVDLVRRQVRNALRRDVDRVEGLKLSRRAKELRRERRARALLPASERGPGRGP